MMGLSNPVHLAFLMLVLLLVFGAKRLPEMGRSLGHGLAGFKDAIGGEATPEVSHLLTDSATHPGSDPAVRVSPVATDHAPVDHAHVVHAAADHAAGDRAQAA